MSKEDIPKEPSRGEKGLVAPAEVGKKWKPGEIFEEETEAQATLDRGIRAVEEKEQMKVVNKFDYPFDRSDAGKPLAVAMMNHVDNELIDTLSNRFPGYSAPNFPQFDIKATQNALSSVLREDRINPERKVKPGQVLNLIVTDGKRKFEFSA